LGERDSFSREPPPPYRAPIVMLNAVKHPLVRRPPPPEVGPPPETPRSAPMVADMPPGRLLRVTSDTLRLQDVFGAAIDGYDYALHRGKLEKRQGNGSPDDHHPH